MEPGQGDIASRQAAIAETQHQIMLQQLAKRTDLRVRAPSQRRIIGLTTGQLDATVVTFVVHNGGDKSSDGFYWEILVPRAFMGAIDFTNLAEDREIKPKFTPFSQTDVYDKVEGHYNHKLYPYTPVPIVKMIVKTQHVASQQFTIKWRIRGDDGVIPKEGLAEIGFKKQSDQMFAVSHPEQGDQVDFSAPVFQQGSQS